MKKILYLIDKIIKLIPIKSYNLHEFIEKLKREGCREVSVTPKTHKILLETKIPNGRPLVFNEDGSDIFGFATIKEVEEARSKRISLLIDELKLYVPGLMVTKG